MRAPQMPLCATPLTYCLLGFDWADTLHLSRSIVNTCCHTALHQVTDRPRRVCAYTLRAKMRLSGPVFTASLPSSNKPAFVPPLDPRVQNASFANCNL